MKIISPRKSGHRRRPRRILEYIGYVACVVTFLSIVGPYILGRSLWSALELFVVRLVLIGLTVTFLWPALCRWSFYLRRWLFARFVRDLTPEIRELVKDLRPERALDYKLEGAILKKEGYRHVAARIETIQVIFDALLKASGGVEDRLKEVGRKVGRNFVHTTWRQMQEHVLAARGIPGPSQPSPGQPISAEHISRRLSLWAEMEKTAGWGEFQPDVKPVGNVLRGVITVTDCFLAAPPRNSQDPRLCAFLEGYMEQIISGLTGHGVSVHEVSCGRKFGADKNCVFTVEP